MEGSAANQFVQLIRQLGKDRKFRLELGTVLSAPPALSVQVDHMNLALNRDDLLVAEHLLQHERKIEEHDGTVREETILSSLQPGDRVCVAVMQYDQMYVVLEKVVGA